MVSTILKAPIFTPLRRCAAVRRLAHRFLAAGDHDVAVAVEDRLIAERDRAQAGAAELVDAPGGAFHRDAGGDRGLPGRVLALPGGQDLPHDHFGDPPPSTPARLSASSIATLPSSWAGRFGEGPVEGADRRTGGADDDNIVLHCKLSLAEAGRKPASDLSSAWI